MGVSRVWGRGHVLQQVLSQEGREAKMRPKLPATSSVAFYHRFSKTEVSVRGFFCCCFAQRVRQKTNKQEILQRTATDSTAERDRTDLLLQSGTVGQLGEQRRFILRMLLLLLLLLGELNRWRQDKNKGSGQK